MTPVGGGLSWQSYNEETPSPDDSDTLSANGLLDVNIGSDEGFLRNGKVPFRTVMSVCHAMHVFINGQLSGNIYGGLDNPRLTYSGNVKLRAGSNKISLLSVAVGLPNVGLYFETWNTGVLGPVTLSGLNEGTRDLTIQRWSYKVGLKGESLSLHTLSGGSSVEWVEGSILAQKQPLTWYKATFDAHEGNNPLALGMGSMGKGQVWVNGEGVGRHWPGYIAKGHYGECNYAGMYTDKKCQTNCGSLLKDVFEEWGGDPTGISLVRRETARVCADIVDDQPTLKNWRMAGSGKSDNMNPKAHLWCPNGQKISKIQFASYGVPQGTCGNFLEGTCHAHKSYDSFEKNCIGEQSCSVNVVPEVF
ncbi:hypothetical protein RND71_028399 [Anisodus tanguticus]|uniref:SUEL-type lectin domain-containing protein n=1 Tax=Anisodus tanguticus TaxID=243964 RepID=A0AAE1RKV1_9SOLA|nr:hypothetical protein RND71_028399 [Anisodus tanguticus]